MYICDPLRVFYSHIHQTPRNTNQGRRSIGLLRSVHYLLLKLMNCFVLCTIGTASEANAPSIVIWHAARISRIGPSRNKDLTLCLLFLLIKNSELDDAFWFPGVIILLA